MTKYLLLSWPISEPENTVIGIEQDGCLVDYACAPGEYYGEPNFETRGVLIQNGWLPREISKDQYAALKSLWSDLPA